MLKKFNELKSTTYLSAADKAKEFGQTKRSNKIINFVFHEFIGKEINDTSIKSIIYGGGITHKCLYIQLLKGDPIVYGIVQDKLDNASMIDRKSANLLSKIITKANPDSKYKNVNYIKIEEY